jgi:hypothetical protein
MEPFSMIEVAMFKAEAAKLIVHSFPDSLHYLASRACLRHLK